MSAEGARDFRRGLSAAAAASDPEARLAQLAALSTPNLGYLETLQIDRALSMLRPALPRSRAALRLAVLGTATVNHLLPAIRVAGLRRQLLVDAHAGSFALYRQEILGRDELLAEFAPDTLLLSLTADEFISGVPVGAQRDAADGAIDRAVADLRGIWRAVRDRFGATVVQQSFLDVSPSLFGNHDRLVPGAPARLIARLNDAVAEAAADDGVLLLDVASASARDGLGAWYDRRHWLQGKMQVAPDAAGRYAELLTRLLGAHRGASKKCLVLDLDNTLWGGVLGDDGIEGVKLGPGSALGEAHLALQRYAKQLQERGVVLAVCSKNEPDLVASMFAKHPEMWLRQGDIAAFAVNWNDKAENLRALATQLNLGLDSFVFVDDNPAERARIRESLPMVAVPEMPTDPADYVAAIAGGGYFEAIALTEEDRLRTQFYTANNEREALSASSQSIDDFLRGLQMTLVYGPVTQVDLPRATQLINKTNQFNTTTRRLSADEVALRAASSADLLLQFRLRDRFGDSGLVSVMLLQQSSSDAGVLLLDNWVMSCRVFGRQLEHAALNLAVDAARARGVRTIVADYVPTEKNVVVKDLFSKLGFHPLGPAAAGGASRWTLDVATYASHPTYIRTQAQDHD